MNNNSILSLDNFSQSDIKGILDRTDFFLSFLKEGSENSELLKGKTIVNLFFEPSTRTKVSFEIAAKKLSADVINFSSMTSSLKKGESPEDTLKTIASMKPDLFIIRHSDSGFVRYLAQKTSVPVINAGDGRNEHPTQALLDIYTISRHFKKLSGLKALICGDILNSRVARSNIKLFKKMDIDTACAAPPMLFPEDFSFFNIKRYSCIDDVIEDADIIYMLRMQFERQDKKYYPSAAEYNEFFSINQKRIKMMKKNSIIMHPGPVNRGIEIAFEIMDQEDNMTDKIKINEQVRNGAAVRMALLELVLSK